MTAHAQTQDSPQASLADQITAEHEHLDVAWDNHRLTLTMPVPVAITLYFAAQQSSKPLTGRLEDRLETELETAWFDATERVEVTITHSYDGWQTSFNGLIGQPAELTGDQKTHLNAIREAIDNASQPSEVELITEIQTLKEGDQILFRDRTIPCTVEEEAGEPTATGYQSITVRGPRGARIVIYQEDGKPDSAGGGPIDNLRRVIEDA